MIQNTEIKLPNKEMSIGIIKVEDNDLTNYFKTSIRDKTKSVNMVKYSNGANKINEINDLGNYMKKINFFDESDGFLKEEKFID